MIKLLRLLGINDSIQGCLLCVEVPTWVPVPMVKQLIRFYENLDWSTL